MQFLRVAAALFTLLVVAVLAGGPPASAASNCPTQTYLSFDRLAYLATTIPATVRLLPGSGVGGGRVDEPTNANGCRRAQAAVQVQTAGSVQPQVAVLVRGRPRTVFVIGHRCDGFTSPAYWDCLLRPLVFHGRPFTATSYPSTPAPRKTVPLGAAIGTAEYHSQTVTVRRIQGVSPSLAVGISGQPSVAFLGARACPYSGFSNTALYDNLLRCLRSPAWFTFDPVGSQVGATVIARSDRPVPPVVAGASISLVALSVAADLVPTHHGRLIFVGRVAEQVGLRIPTVPAGLYEAVVSCPRCGSPSDGPTGLYPAGSILVTAKPHTSLGITIVSYALAIAFLAAAILAFKIWRRRRRRRAAATTPLPGAGGA